MSDKSKVLIAGFFDMLHSGHVKFFKDASAYGELHVVIGSDENSVVNKGKLPVCSENERKYMVESIRYVHKAYVHKNITSLNFTEIADEIKPTHFVINEDGDTLEKREIVERRGIEYVVLSRIPEVGMSQRSTTDIKEIDNIPHRLDIVGFFDQVFLSKTCAGSTIMCGLEPMVLEERSGMASSTRKTIKKIFGNSLPKNKSERDIAEIIFACDNPPGREYISGTVDALGLISKGISKFNYAGDYWPKDTIKILDNNILEWFESVVKLKQTWPRPDNYSVYTGIENYTLGKVRRLSDVGEATWQAIKRMDTKELGACVNETCAACRDMIPGYISEEIRPVVEEHQQKYLGCKLMGAGGYGYMMIVADAPVEGSLKINVRRKLST